MKIKAFALICLSSAVVAFASSLSSITEILSEKDVEVAQKYLQLRMEYTKSDNYEPRPFYHGLVADATDLYRQGKYDEVLEKIAPTLEKDPYSLKLLPIKRYALAQLGKTNEAHAVHETYMGIVNSIFISGDGHSPKTAMRVISIDEEYAIVRDFLGLRPVAQALISHNGHSYDVLTIRDPRKSDTDEENTFKLYFNVDPLFGGSLLNALANPTPKSPSTPTTPPSEQ